MVGIEDKKHASLPPSAAKRWMNCPLSAKYGSRPAGPDAAEGTVAHGIAEELITGKADYLSLADRIGTTVRQGKFDVVITEEMIAHAQAYRDLIEGIKEEFRKENRPAPVEFLVEQRVKASSIDERVWGTADCVILRRGHRLVVVDYKYGKGVVVEAEDNEQGMIYVCGVQDSLAGEAFDQVEFIIHQPRAPHVEGAIRRVVISKEALADFRRRAKIAAMETLEAEPRSEAGDWCRWCAAEADCPTRRALVQTRAGIAFADAPPLDEKAVAEKVRAMAIEDLVQALRWEDFVSSYFTAVKSTLEARINSGAKADGVKFVQGRSNRQWRDEKEAEKELGKVVAVERLWEKSFISPAQAEKVIGKKAGKELVDRLTIRPEGKRTLVLDTDVRREIVPAAKAAEVFAPVIANAPSPSLKGPLDVWPSNDDSSVIKTT